MPSRSSRWSFPNARPIQSVEFPEWAAFYTIKGLSAVAFYSISERQIALANNRIATLVDISVTGNKQCRESCIKHRVGLFNSGHCYGGGGGLNRKGHIRKGAYSHNQMKRIYVIPFHFF